MDMNSLQHYGTKGMEWGKKKPRSRATNSSYFAPNSDNLWYNRNRTVPGNPTMVYTSRGTAVMKPKKSTRTTTAKATLKDLPGDMVNAGRSFLDDLFAVKRKKT